MFVGSGCAGAKYGFAYGWPVLNPKQRPTQPQKPGLGKPLGSTVEFIDVFEYVAIWADAIPTMTRAMAAMATKATTIFVLCISFITIL